MLALLWCSPLGHPALAAEPIRIGFVGSLTGYLVELDAGARDGMQIAIDEINRSGGVLGRKLEVLIEDNRSEPSAAVTALNKLLTSAQVDLIVGGLSSAATRAMSPILVRHKMPAMVGSILPGEDDKQGRRWIFTSIIPIDYDVRARLDYLKRRGATRIAILHDTTPYSKLGAERAISLAGQDGFVLLGVEQYSPAATDLSPQLTKLKALGPQAVLQMGGGPAIGLAAKNLHDIGFEVLHLSDQNTNPREVEKIAGSAATGLMFAATPSVIYDSLPDGDPRKLAASGFIEAWRAKYGSERDPNVAARCYDSMRLLAEAVRRAGSTDGAAVRDAMEGIQNFPGATSVFSFSPDDHSGLTKSPVVLVQIDAGGKLTILK